MSAIPDLAGTGLWQRIFFETFQGNPEHRRYRIPLIEPFEIPFVLERHTLAVTATCLEARGTWRRAGYLTQVVSGISLESNSPVFTINSPTSGVDVHTEMIRLNNLQLVRLPQIAQQFYLWFDPVPWMPRLTLGIWEFTGMTIPDNTEDLLQTIKVDLARLEYKIDFQNTWGQ